MYQPLTICAILKYTHKDKTFMSPLDIQLSSLFSCIYTLILHYIIVCVC